MTPIRAVGLYMNGHNNTIRTKTSDQGLFTPQPLGSRLFKTQDRNTCTMQSSTVWYLTSFKRYTSLDRACSVCLIAVFFLPLVIPQIINSHWPDTLFASHISPYNTHWSVTMFVAHKPPNTHWSVTLFVADKPPNTHWSVTLFGGHKPPNTHWSVILFVGHKPSTTL